jgi:hypothetical protein
MYASENDSKFFLEVSKGLATLAGLTGTGKDKYGVPLPYGVGPHSVRCMRAVVDIVKPKTILEIGFNMGYSSAIWLTLTDANVVGVDISDKDETLHGAKVLSERYPGRFEFVLSDSAQVLPKLEGRQFDMIFIDGGHLEHHVMNDIGIAKALNIPRLCFDDWLPEFGPGVQPAIKNWGLNVEHVFGNIALASWGTK